MSHPTTLADWNKCYVSQWRNVLVTPEANGIRLTLTEEGRERLTEIRDSYGDRWNDTQVFIELIEDMLGNGWMEINPDTIALCSIPIILTQEGDLHDDGTVTCSLCYAHTNYALELACEALESERGLFLECGGAVTRRDCPRCGTDCDGDGYCTDETCPFSDHTQHCRAGWAGHPDRDDSGDEGLPCTCGGRKKTAE